MTNSEVEKLTFLKLHEFSRLHANPHEPSKQLQEKPDTKMDRNMKSLRGFRQFLQEKTLYKTLLNSQKESGDCPTLSASLRLETQLLCSRSPTESHGVPTAHH
ncbi:hypothetical protein V6N13_024647 [Hibiscus sabdariffa]|uniref:Uncharacterized protein n=2 Tax=Hibiscus sabdariffa TaxID=183260 RepID=A0ABR1Z8P9_9ROSI